MPLSRAIHKTEADRKQNRSSITDTTLKPMGRACAGLNVAPTCRSPVAGSFHAGTGESGAAPTVFPFVSME